MSGRRREADLTVTEPALSVAEGHGLSRAINRRSAEPALSLSKGATLLPQSLP
jgi:hypothetical protein